MSDDTSINGGADPDTGTLVGSLDQGGVLGPEEAAAIMREQDERAQQAFRISHRGAFAAWGILIFLAYGITWLAVRHEQPVHGPNPIGYAVATLLWTAAGLAGRAEARSDAGVGGVSVWRRRVQLLALVAGLAAMFGLEGALYRAGAGRPVRGLGGGRAGRGPGLPVHGGLRAPPAPGGWVPPAALVRETHE